MYDQNHVIVAAILYSQNANTAGGTKCTGIICVTPPQQGCRQNTDW